MCIGSALRVASLCASGLCVVGSGSQRLMKKDVKVGYGILALFFAVLLALVMFVFSDWINFVGDWIGCTSSSSQKACIGVSAAFR